MNVIDPKELERDCREKPAFAFRTPLVPWKARKGSAGSRAW